ncbi:hypothetical protein GCM10027168_37100 [Streptomyces capparidis]
MNTPHTPRTAHLTPAVADPYCLTDEEAVFLLAGAPWRRFAVLGDSIAEGAREAVPGYPDLGWADLVAEALRLVAPAVEYRNLGRRDLVAARIRETQLGPALDFGPDLAAVTAGGNDMLGRTFDPEAVEAELLRLVRPLRDAGCTVVTLGLFDNTGSPYVPERFRAAIAERLRVLNGLTADVSARLGCLHVDLSGHPAEAQDIHATDGLHLNTRGHAVVAAATVRVLAAHVDAARPGSPRPGSPRRGGGAHGTLGPLGRGGQRAEKE